MQIAAVTILYNPSIEVVKNILSYYNLVNELYIVDNSLDENSFIKEKLDKDNVFYLHDGENKGIAARLNQVSKILTNKGFEWLLTMDQDSFFDEKDLKKYFDLISKYELKDSTAMFGVNYVQALSEKNLMEECVYLITSGSVVNLNVMKVIGDFDENIFIDWVDSEYCYRSLIRGFKIIQCSGIYLHHSLGEIKMGISMKSGKYTPRILHSPERMYYLVRNYFYILKKLPELSSEIRAGMRRNILNRIKNNLLYNKRAKVAKYILKGYIDFKKNKMGKM